MVLLWHRVSRAKVKVSAKGSIISDQTTTDQFTILAGGLIINCVCRGTSTIPSNWSWRIPYCLFLVIPSIVASLIWFCPESPRYYAMKGMDEKAIASLKKFKGKTETFDAEVECEGYDLQSLIPIASQLTPFGSATFEGCHCSRTSSGHIC